MLIHTVLFWLKDDVDARQRSEFETGMLRLAGIPSVQRVHVGTPPPERPVIEASYDYCLTVLFDSLADHDLYQDDPIHTDFATRYRTLWTRVLVLDSQEIDRRDGA